MTRISACLIVKDEEQHLPRCLKSLIDKVDEIVVVDTGSTDGTVAIAKEFGARVFHFPWCNDFGAARNESIRHATGDWAVWIDADEALIETEPGSLRLLCGRLPPRFAGYWTLCQNLKDENGDVGSVANQWRIFRNHRGARFYGCVHEQLRLPPGTDIVLLAQERVFIRHWGYIAKPGVLERKSQRNRPLLERAMAEDPEEPAYPYFLGKQYAGQGNYEAAVPHLERAISLWQKLGHQNYAYLSNLLTVTVATCVRTDRPERALEVERLIPAFLVSADSLYHAAFACWRLGRPEEAIERLNRAWQDPTVRIAFENDPTCATWRPLLALAELYGEQGKFEEAYEYAEKAHSHAPTEPSILYALGYLSARLETFNECLNWTQQLITGERDGGFKAQGRRLLLNLARGIGNPALMLQALRGEVTGISEPEAVLLRAEAHHQNGDNQSQYNVLDEGCRQFPEEFPIRLALANLLESAGFEKEAADVLAGGLDHPDVPPELYERLASLLAKQHQFQEAADALELAGRLRAAAARSSHSLALS